ncbi:site-specific DNA recombinase [Mycetohabitans endofungorum]|uniref:Site-specific DNA recombinase n=1 Tax=Mycetohabitans endofungorum TaxID=417203 RepID=A0A2P5K6K7_9BURK|nr:site-specific DNA recombinase [Mycetohabitans endofungorum]
MSKAAVVALYARVSSEQQNKRGTVESQLAALKERISADGAQIAEDMCFVDAGVSGATLIRPQLERLRDCAALSAIDQLYILSPDRLARKYAHQALLMEEFAACGVQVVFLNHAIGTTPEESLLLQMQGMIAEYERAKIAERHRRGKLHGAKRGSINVLSGAPYGYRYIRRQLDATPARYVIELPQAATVRSIFQWVGMERLSIGEVVRRLTDSGTVTASGKPYWDRSVVWGILRNPAYMGRAAFGKTQSCDHLARVRAQRHSADVPRKPHSTTRTHPQDWIEIAVPAIISEALFQSAQEQLAENRKLARHRRESAPLRLLQGLTVCGQCRYAYYAKKVSKAAAKGHQRNYAYYRCVGTDAYRFGGQRICDNLQVRTDKLDDLVWQQVVQLLRQPERLKNEYERRLDMMERNERNSLATSHLEKQRIQLEKGKSRLIDSYAEGIIDKTDFEPRMQQLKNRIEQIDQQILESKQQGAVQSELFLVINRLEEFAGAITQKLDTIELETKHRIVLGLVKRVEIHKDEIVVVFRVDPQAGALANENSNDSDHGVKSTQHCTRRTLTPVIQHHVARIRCVDGKELPKQEGAQRSMGVELRHSQTASHYCARKPPVETSCRLLSVCR